MSLRIAFNGSAALQAALQDAASSIRREVEDAIAETALAIDAEVKLRIQRSPASGRVYQKYNPSRVHKASAPGEAPATDTGTLINSIYTDLEGLSATVGSRVVYSVYLEYGTTRMAPRPVWEPVVERERLDFTARMEAAISRAMA